MNSVYDFTYPELERWLDERGHRAFRAKQVWRYLYRDRAMQWDDMSELHPSCLHTLRSECSLRSMTEHTKQVSKDGTIKFLFQLHDQHLIETVLMKHKFGRSVCVTTQVGCNIGCSFCASGLIAKQRDLTSGEIVEQVVLAQRELDRLGTGERVTNLVVMGIGEPFDNYDHLDSFLRTIMDPLGLAIGSRHITVSTSGLANKIREFADSDLNVNLAISLHAPSDALRTQIMRINRAIPLAELMDSLDYFLARTRRRTTIEYILLRGVNDQPEHAIELCALLEARREHVIVNLIPYNPVDEHSQYERSEQESIRVFYDILKKHKFSCSVRLEHGADIDAACGQLRSKQTTKNPSPSRV